MDDVTVLLALQEKTVGRNDMIVADAYMMQRLGIVCPLDSNPGSSLQRVHFAATENNIDYARPWEPIDLHVDDVTVLLALQEKTVGRNGISYMMKRLRIACPLDSNPG